MSIIYHQIHTECYKRDVLTSICISALKMDRSNARLCSSMLLVPTDPFIPGIWVCRINVNISNIHTITDIVISLKLKPWDIWGGKWSPGCARGRPWHLRWHTWAWRVLAAGWWRRAEEVSGETPHLRPTAAHLNTHTSFHLNKAYGCWTLQCKAKQFK